MPRPLASPMPRCLPTNTCYPMNASDKLGPLTLVVPIYGWLMPLVFIVTLVSNSLIIMVLSRASMQSPTNTVLLGMAACDLVTIIVPAPW